MGYPPVRITAAVRSGDTPQNERAAMLRTPPHILVTTPESLYLLLTAERSREMLKTARVVIVDEIHAVLESRRGAHLALSLERLDHVCGRRLQRIGLSATQKPIEEVARFLVGTTASGECAIVDRGHKRAMDLAIEVPGSPLEAVMSAEVWQEIYERLVELIEAHRTTLIMVNTRRLAERMAHQLIEHLGAEHVAAHHGSLSKEERLDAEERLRERQAQGAGGHRVARARHRHRPRRPRLPDLVAAPHRDAAAARRALGSHGARPAEGARLPADARRPRSNARRWCARCTTASSTASACRTSRSTCWRSRSSPKRPREEWDEDALVRPACAAPIRIAISTRDEFDDVVDMLAHGYTTQRGRRAALVHHDAVNASCARARARA